MKLESKDIDAVLYLINLKKKNPKEYKELLKDIKGVLKDLTRMIDEIREKRKTDEIFHPTGREWG